LATCEAPHSASSPIGLQSLKTPRGSTISKEESFSDCVILTKDAFDPDAVFLEDIVDDDVLPYLSLAVDGLNTNGERKKPDMELRPEDAANEEMPASTTMPVATLHPDQLEVYGWESSLWKKVRGYLGF
jgi:hypothetical protein